MSENAQKAYEAMLVTVGNEAATGEWFELTQERINDFADTTLDHQFIHIDPEKAAQTPFGGTVAHGFLTLSMLVHLSTTIQMNEEIDNISNEKMREKLLNSKDNALLSKQLVTILTDVKIDATINDFEKKEGSATQTLLNNIDVIIHHKDKNLISLFVRRSFSEHLWSWINDSASRL